MLCNETPSMGLLFFTIKIYIACPENFEQPGYLIWSTTQELLLFCYLNFNFNHFLELNSHCSGLEFHLITKLISWFVSCLGNSTTLEVVGMNLICYDDCSRETTGTRSIKCFNITAYSLLILHLLN